MQDIQAVRNANLKRVVYIALCFMVFFTAYIVTQNLISTIYKQLGYSSLGQICIFFVCGTTGVVCTVATHYTNKISFKTGLVAGGSAIAALILAGAMTTFCNDFNIQGAICNSFSISLINVIASMSVGVGGSFLWLCQAKYVNDCSDEQTKGIFNGIFWSLFQTNQIIGSALATLLLGSFQASSFFCLLLVFAGVALVMLNFVQPPVKNTSQGSKEEETNAQDKQESGIDAFKSFMSLFSDRKNYFLFAALFFGGLAIGSYINFMGAYVTSTLDLPADLSAEEKDMKIRQNVGFAFLVLAIGEVAAGLSVGKLADKFDKLKLFTGTLMFNEAALAVTLLAVLTKSYTLCVIAAFMWGYGDTGINTMVNAVIGSIFNGKTELFSAYRCLMSFGTMYSSALAIFIPTDIPSLYIIAIAGSMLACHMLYNKYLPRSQKMSQHLLDDHQKILVELKNF